MTAPYKLDRRRPVFHRLLECDPAGNRKQERFRGFDRMNSPRLPNPEIRLLYDIIHIPDRWKRAPQIGLELGVVGMDLVGKPLRLLHR